MKICSWNIGWTHANKKKRENNEEKELRIRKNNKRATVAEAILNAEKADVLTLLESGDAYSPDILGYKKFFLDRKYLYKGFNNGILLYIKECYSPVVCEESLQEFKDNKIGCFLPITLTGNEGTLNCLFVWTTMKYGENGETDPYGFNRFNEIFFTTNFPKTKEFIDGNKNNVIIIGDFNIVYKENDIKLDRKKRWQTLIKLMEDSGLLWMKNVENTFNNNIINDHCFVSIKLHPKTNLVVGNDSYEEIKSDHRMITINISLDTRTFW